MAGRCEGFAEFDSLVNFQQSFLLDVKVVVGVEYLMDVSL